MNSGFDLTKVPFFSFLFLYSGILVFLSIVAYFTQNLWIALHPYVVGFFAGLWLQGSIYLLKVFFMNKDWSSPVTIQLFLTISSFFLSAVMLYFFVQIDKNIPAIVGFFIAYYLNLKIIVLIAHFFTRNAEND